MQQNDIKCANAFIEAWQLYQQILNVSAFNSTCSPQSIVWDDSVLFVQCDQVLEQSIRFINFINYSQQ